MRENGINMILYKKFQEGGVLKRDGDPYEYRKTGNEYYTRKKGTSKWIKTSGNAAKAIAKLYPAPTPQIPKEVSSETNNSEEPGLLSSLVTAVEGFFDGNDADTLNTSETSPRIIDKLTQTDVYNMLGKTGEEATTLIEELKEAGKLPAFFPGENIDRQVAKAFAEYKGNDNPLEKLRDFNTIKKATQQHCASGLCNTYSAAGINPRAAGLSGNHAWIMLKGITNHGGEKLFNAYENFGDKFAKAKSPTEIRNLTKDVLASIDKSAFSKLEVGDVVGLYFPGSSHHLEAKEDANKYGTGTYNTHVGYVADVRNGIPYIRHNIYGKWHLDPITKVYPVWAARINKESMKDENIFYQTLKGLYKKYLK